MSEILRQRGIDEAAIVALQNKYGKGPFLAADAVVQSEDGYILLIRRGNAPGQGLWALPGGKLDDDETFWGACCRELIEETGLTLDGKLSSYINEHLLESHIEGFKICDDPKRDPRGRWISVAYFIALPWSARELLVQAGDDAQKGSAQWVSIEDYMTDEEFFADHLQIIRYFLDKAK